MASLLADEGFPRPVTDELRLLGHDVLTLQQAGLSGRGIADIDVLFFAIAQGRAVITRNRRHFIRLHRQIRPHTGIIVCSEDSDMQGQAARIHQAILGQTHLANQLIRVNRPPSP